MWSIAKFGGFSVMTNEKRVIDRGFYEVFFEGNFSPRALRHSRLTVGGVCVSMCF